MECINATSLPRKSGQWGTQPLLPVKQAGLPSQLANASRLLDGFVRKINKITASPTASRGRQDDDSVGVLAKNTLNKLALMELRYSGLIETAKTLMQFKRQR
jgi:hypothetical protein